MCNHFDRILAYDTGTLTLMCLIHCISKQEAQLSQRDCAMLCVIEYFANSLNVTQDHSK